MGFPTGDRFKGTQEQKDRLERQYLRKQEFMAEHKVPIWNGEFGPVYDDPKTTADAASINQDRYNLLGQQLEIYDKYQISWSIWLYKDIGVQGMIYTSPDSKWNQTIQTFLDKKKALRLDAWGMPFPSDVKEALTPLLQWIDQVAPTAKETYPTPWATERHVLRAIHQSFVSQAFSDEFASLFKGMDFDELEQLARSFHYDQCVQRDGLNKILTSHAELHSSSG